MLQIPIFHVNGEDPEAVAQVVRLALDFRREFQRDVVIDMYCYRRRGHNEGDEPAFTQPLLYEAIEQPQDRAATAISNTCSRWAASRADEADRIADEAPRAARSGAVASPAATTSCPSPTTLAGVWNGYIGGRQRRAGRVDTGVARERLASLLERLTRRARRFPPASASSSALLDARRAMARGEQPLDWSAAEALALASLAAEGVRVRLTGQDSQRGTFSQRHAVLHDTQDGHTLHAAAASCAGPGAGRDLQQPAVRGGRAGLRVRLQPRLPRRRW